jgi:hypothetical protein
MGHAQVLAQRLPHGPAKALRVLHDGDVDGPPQVLDGVFDAIFVADPLKLGHESLLKLPWINAFIEAERKLRPFRNARVRDAHIKRALFLVGEKEIAQTERGFTEPAIQLAAQIERIAKLACNLGGQVFGDFIKLGQLLAEERLGKGHIRTKTVASCLSRIARSYRSGLDRQIAGPVPLRMASRISCFDV